MIEKLLGISALTAINLFVIIGFFRSLSRFIRIYGSNRKPKTKIRGSIPLLIYIAIIVFWIVIQKRILTSSAIRTANQSAEGAYIVWEIFRWAIFTVVAYGCYRGIYDIIKHKKTHKSTTQIALFIIICLLMFFVTWCILYSQ